MHNSIWPYVLLFITLILLSSIAQTLLKISANKNHPTRIKEYINPYVIIGYALFFIASFGSVYCYRYLDLKQGGVLQMTSYIFILILGHFVLKETITKKKMFGMILIMLGIFIFYFGVN